MANYSRRSGRNKDGSYDLSEAQNARRSRRRSRLPEDGMTVSGAHQVRSTGRQRRRDDYRQQSAHGTRDMHDRYGQEHERYASSYGRHAHREDTAPHHHVEYSRQDAHAHSSRRPGASRYHEEEGSHASDYSRSAARYHEQKRGMSRGKKIALGVVIGLLVVLAAGGTAFGLWYNSIMNNLKGDHNIGGLSDVSGDEPYYVLLLGGDSREGTKDNNRSDSIMVARVDETNKQVSLLSIPRDLRINMGEHGYQKINAAIEFGGYDYVIQIVNQLLGIQINYYAFIYFDGFEQLVDKLGGVTVEVPEGTYYAGVSVPAGDAVQINGQEALVLARCRHGNPPDQGAYAMGDYQRTLNQRNLIKAIGKKVLQSDVTQLPDLITGLSECVETNMDVSRIVSLAENMKGMDMDAMEAEQLPIAGTTETGGTGWCAVLYNDVFEVMRDNFVNGRSLLTGLDGFDEQHNDDDVGSDYVDGELYGYTTYADKYGDPMSSTASTGEEGTE